LGSLGPGAAGNQRTGLCGLTPPRYALAMINGAMINVAIVNSAVILVG
jgi:hypothetical protein